MNKDSYYHYVANTAKCHYSRHELLKSYITGRAPLACKKGEVFLSRVMAPTVCLISMSMMTISLGYTTRRWCRCAREKVTWMQSERGTASSPLGKGREEDENSDTQSSQVVT